jgi:hypothetical protein
MLPSAQLQTAGETNQSRWDSARLRLVILIGVIVALAIVSIAVAVLSSAQRADEVSAASQQQLITRAINEHADRTLHHLESVAATPRTILRIRENFDPGWVDRRLGQWLQKFYNSDIVVIFGADDQILYTRLKIPGVTSSDDLRGEPGPTLDFLRGRLSALPPGVVPTVAPAEPAQPVAGVAVIQRFLGQPAVVAAATIGNP